MTIRLPSLGHRAAWLPRAVRRMVPTILAGALLAFAISVDDFVITYFNSGSTITFPVYVWGQAARGVPPQVNVIGSAIFLVAIAIMLANAVIQTRRERSPV